MNIQLSLEKKINKFGQKAKILQKNENAHEIRKKRPGLCPGVSVNFLRFSIQIKFLCLKIDSAALKKAAESLPPPPIGGR